MNQKFLLASVLCVFAAPLAQADDAFPLRAELMGNTCMVTNDTATAIRIDRVIFTYACEDSITRRSPLNPGDVLQIGESKHYHFPGHEGGCMSVFVTGCKANGIAH